MKSYYRIMLGKQSAYAQDAFDEGIVGIHEDFIGDLTGRLPDDWRTFNKEMIPVYLSVYPEKSKIAAGLACGFMWTVCKGVRVGDVVLSPDGTGSYHIAEVTGDYYYMDAPFFPHRRRVKWSGKRIERSAMSESLRNSAGSIGTVSNITKYAEEIDRLIKGDDAPKIISTDETIEDASAFAMEKHLEEFLVQNWSQTELGKEYDIFEVDGEKVGQQYLTDTGPMDILAVKKDKSELLVVELKRGRASDVVVGQTLRYMGYALQELAESHQKVRGVIIALEDDQRIRRALAATPSIEFYRYQVSFRMQKV